MTFKMPYRQPMADAYVEKLNGRLSMPGRPPSGMTVQTDPALPGVKFHRFSDGSAFRLDPDGDAQPF
jgi:hypothetical protein